MKKVNNNFFFNIIIIIWALVGNKEDIDGDYGEVDED